MGWGQIGSLNVLMIMSLIMIGCCIIIILVRKLILPSKKFVRNLRGTYNSTILKQSTEKPTAEICDHSPIIPTL